MSDNISTPANRLFKHRAYQHTKKRLFLRISERKLLLTAGDLFLLNMTLLLTLSIRFGVEFLQAEPFRTASWFLLFNFIWLGMAALFDVYSLARAASPAHSMWSAAIVVTVTILIYYTIPFITPSLPRSRSDLFILPVLAISLVVIWRYLYAVVLVQPSFNQTAVVIGAGWSGRTLAQTIAEQDDPPTKHTGAAYHILAFIDDDDEKQGTEIEGVPVLGNRDNLLEVVERLRPDEVVIAITHLQKIHSTLFQGILDCQEKGIPLSTMTALYERMTGRVPVEHAGRDIHVVLPVERPSAFRLYLVFRRILEVWLSFLGCLFVLALVPIVWIIHHFTAPGDLFYRQERVGYGGMPFDVIKFRTMIMDAEKNTGAVWAQENDDRITALGRFLRKTRLDEVPQFWNVLKGDMSLIGPRPERPVFVQTLEKDIPFYRVRHSVKPGITGWAQVKYRYGASTKDALIKLQYDLYYIKHIGPYLDLSIFMRTVQVMLGFRGR